jgi:DeoR family transcriptional regulator, aga operon transcriptional repressor
VGEEIIVTKVSPQSASERRQRIIELLMNQGAVRVQELSDLFMVSEVTIRNDLDIMARDGQLRRHRGGAIAAPLPNLSIAFERRASLNLEKKRQIGRAAAQLVSAGDTIIMDSGTTLVEMSKSLNTSDKVTVVTNALNVATQVGALPNALVILPGGTLNRETISTFGPETERSLSNHVVQKAFLGIQAIDPELGLTDTSSEIAYVKQSMIRAARRVILLADSSKWRRVAFVKVVPLSAIHTVVTDSDLPDEARAAIERVGVELIVV